MTKLMTVQTQTAQPQVTQLQILQPLTVRAFRGVQVMLLAALAASSLGSASAQPRAATLAQPVQQMQSIKIPVTGAPVRHVTPPIQALPTYPNQTPPDGCSWIYRNGWQLACREMMSASGAVISSALVVDEQPGTSSGTASVPTGPQALPTLPSYTPAGCTWVSRGSYVGGGVVMGWILICGPIQPHSGPFDSDPRI
ncbi:hypothetical protein EHF33_13380 [Deinococcus psychrotolerans]|uniref:Uncharacterized protein n=1 Tax=Deinococcus psychrotolerans TaxID=2489213 RepID=A0A3G8YQX7_9DEIO|nr:hypothetical protein [Deinococcus psychrotolerans]AZI43616.1 hypothetical protein EHF33_13380 [Deinococcus psychrotolerans]